MFRSLRLVLLVGAVSVLPGPWVMAQTPGWLPCCAAASDAVVAVIDGESVRVPDLDTYSRTADPRTLFLLNRQLRDPRSDMLRTFNEELVLEAEAARRGQTVRQLLNERLVVKPVSDAAILRILERIHEEHPAVSDNEILPVIRMFLEGQLRSEATARYVKELKRAAK